MPSSVSKSSRLLNIPDDSLSVLLGFLDLVDDGVVIPKTFLEEILKTPASSVSEENRRAGLSGSKSLELSRARGSRGRGRLGAGKVRAGSVSLARASARAASLTASDGGGEDVEVREIGM